MSEISLPGVGQKSDPSGVVKSAHTHLTDVRVSAGPGADHSRSPDLHHLCDLDPAAPLTDRRRFVKGSPSFVFLAQARDTSQNAIVLSRLGGESGGGVLNPYYIFPFP